MERSLQTYMSKRGFRDYQVVGTAEMRDFTEKEIREKVERNLKSANVVIIAIEDGTDGSRQKALVEKVCGVYKFRTQFIRSCNLRKNAAFMGMMDDAMAKCGGTWFQINYQFEEFDAKDIWVIGMDVYKSTNEEQLSAFNCHLCTDIKNGTLSGNFERGSLPLLPKETCVPLAQIQECLQDIFNRNSVQQLDPPKYILCFRGGVSLGELDTLRTNEVSAMQRAVYATWKKKRPKISFFVVPKGSRVRFNVKRNPLCVADSITGGIYEDFYTQVNTRARKTPRIVRYILVHDEGFFGQAKEIPEDFLKLISGLSHLYPQAISFMNGCCSYPGPLKMAQRAAENFTSQIFEDDKKLEDLGNLPNSTTDVILKLGAISLNDDMDIES